MLVSRECVFEVEKARLAMVADELKNIAERAVDSPADQQSDLADVEAIVVRLTAFLVERRLPA